MSAEYEYETETFECTESGASMTHPVQAGALKLGGFIVISGHACKITALDVSQPGKHGAAKVSVTAVDVFTGKVRKDAASTGHCVLVPFVDVACYQLLDVGRDGKLSLLDDEFETRQDLDLPADDLLGEKIAGAFASEKTVEIRVLKALGLEKILSFKEECGK